MSVTSAVAAESARYLFTSGKEGHIIKWDMTTGKKLATLFKVRINGKGKGKAPPAGDVKGHTDEVLALALSSDGKYLVSGGRDRRVVVWDAEKAEWIKCFTGPMCHRDAVSVSSFHSVRMGTIVNTSVVIIFSQSDTSTLFRLF